LIALIHLRSSHCRKKQCSRRENCRCGASATKTPKDQSSESFLPVSEIHINNCARYDFMQNFRSLVSQRNIISFSQPTIYINCENRNDTACKNNRTVIQQHHHLFFLPQRVIKTRSSRRRSLCLLLPPIIISPPPPTPRAVKTLSCCSARVFPAQVQNRKICPLCVAAVKNCRRPIGKTPRREIKLHF
jgi:hypothetical protein